MKRMLAEADPDRPFLLLLYIEDQVEICFHGFFAQSVDPKAPANRNRCFPGFFVISVIKLTINEIRQIL